MATELLKGLYSYFFEKEEEIPTQPISLEMEKSAADDYILKENGQPIHMYWDREHTYVYALKQNFLKDLERIFKPKGWGIRQVLERDDNVVAVKIFNLKPGQHSGYVYFWVSQFHTSKLIRNIRKRNAAGENVNVDELFRPEVHAVAEEYDGLPFLSARVDPFIHSAKEGKSLMEIIRFALRRLSHTDTELLEKTKKQLEALEEVRPNISENVSRRILSEYLMGYKAAKNDPFFAKGLAPNTRKRARNVGELLEERLVKPKRGGRTRRNRKERA